MTCAIGNARSTLQKKLEPSRSGAIYKSLILPLRTSYIVLLNSAWVSVLLMSAAGIFCTNRPSTWSFIREIRGENTIVSPALQSAGI